MSAWERALKRNDTSNAVVRARNASILRNKNIGSLVDPQQKPVSGPVATEFTLGNPSGSAWERSLYGFGGGSMGEEIRSARTRKPRKPIAPPPDYVPGGNEDTTSTDPSETPKPDPYPTVLPSLSAEQLGQLAERRRIVDERLKQAEAESERRRTLIEASAERSRKDAERSSQRAIQDFMREAGGRGLARSPMVAGRAVRRAGEDLRLSYGEIDTKLSTEIMALQDLVSKAENERDLAMAGIEQDRVNMQADLNRLFPASSMYR